MNPWIVEDDEYEWKESPVQPTASKRIELEPLTEDEEAQSTDPRIEETKNLKSFARRHSIFKQTRGQVGSFKASHSIYQTLLVELRHNEVKGFRTTLESEGLPQDDQWYDYDLLMRALRLDRKRIVIYLLEKNCRVNKPRHLSADVNTPLHLAAAKASGWCDVIDKMLLLGARVTDVNADGNTPLHLAFINDLSDAVVRKLFTHYLAESQEDIRNKDGLGFMHMACKRADFKAVKEFFDIGMSDIWSQISVHADSIYAGYSCLHFAVAANNHELAEFLCQYEADVYAQDRNRSTPLHFALERKDSRMIDILCYYDYKNENYVNDFGVSHFMAACAGTNLQVVVQYLEIAEQGDQLMPNSSVRALLNGRVKDIPHYPNAGYTPVHFACELGSIETVCEYLNSGDGSRFLAQTTHGLTPYELAMGQQREDVGQMIRQFYYANPHLFVQQQQQQPPQEHCGQGVYQHVSEHHSVQTLQMAC